MQFASVLNVSSAEAPSALSLLLSRDPKEWNRPGVPAVSRTKAVMSGLNPSQLTERRTASDTPSLYSQGRCQVFHNVLGMAAFALLISSE